MPRRHLDAARKCRLVTCRNAATRFFWGYGICEDCWHAYENKPISELLQAAGAAGTDRMVFTACPWKNRPVKKSPPMTIDQAFQSARVCAKVQGKPFEIYRKPRSDAAWEHVQTVKPGD